MGNSSSKKNEKGKRSKEEKVTGQCSEVKFNNAKVNFAVGDFIKVFTGKVVNNELICRTFFITEVTSENINKANWILVATSLEPLFTHHHGHQDRDLSSSPCIVDEHFLKDDQICILIGTGEKSHLRLLQTTRKKDDINKVSDIADYSTIFSDYPCEQNIEQYCKEDPRVTKLLSYFNTNSRLKPFLLVTCREKHETFFKEVGRVLDHNNDLVKIVAEYVFSPLLNKKEEKLIHQIHISQINSNNYYDEANYSVCVCCPSSNSENSEKNSVIFGCCSLQIIPKFSQNNIFFNTMVGRLERFKTVHEIRLLNEFNKSDQSTATFSALEKNLDFEYKRHGIYELIHKFHPSLMQIVSLSPANFFMLTTATSLPSFTYSAVYSSPCSLLISRLLYTFVIYFINYRKLIKYICLIFNFSQV
jgi:hypothetical protein